MGPVEKEITAIWREIGKTMATAQASHSRQDRFEKRHDDSLNEIKTSLVGILNRVDSLKTYNDKQRGFVLALTVIGSLLGSSGAISLIMWVLSR